MDDRTFDTVARAVSAGASRRHALRLLAGGILAAWLPQHARTALARQADACEPGLTYCPGVGDSFVCVIGDCICGDLIFCNDQCVDVASDPNNCGECGIVCTSGVCAGGGCTQGSSGCPEGFWDCDGTGNCTSFLDDPYHCGDCGTVCASGVCEGGYCTEIGCEAGLVACPESMHFGPAGCYDLATDPNRCGSCENACGGAGSRTQTACVEGTCVATGCLEGLTDCSGNLDCVDLAYDASNCGTCGTVCPSGTCQAGVCVSEDMTCPPGSTYCPEGFGAVNTAAGCWDLSSEPNQCGACGNVCVSGVCRDGVCADDTTCAAGLTYCPSRQITVGFDNQPSELEAGCYDLSSDKFHCGACENTCATTVPCYGGVCGLLSCDEGQTLCAAGCVDLETDPNNCGACVTACAAGEVCAGGVCGPGTTCAAGLTYCPFRSEACETGVTECTGSCVDLDGDPHNCGECDNVCGSGVCEAGVCAPEDTTCAAGLTYCPFRSDGQPAGCYDLASDYWHCGTCGKPCPTAGFYGVCRGGECVEITCAAGLTFCAAGANGLQPGCYDLATDRDHCGTCFVACAPEEVCEAETCSPITTSSLEQAATTPESENAQGAGNTPEAGNPREAGSGVTGGSDRPKKTPRDRTEQDATASSAATGAGAGPAAPERTITQAGASTPTSVLTWPFDLKAGQWTIVHGYRAEDEDTNRVATPPAEREDFTRLALAFAVCPAANVDAAEGACDLGKAGGDPDWDREATQGSAVVSPVDGTVAWTSGEAACLSVGIEIADHAGYRLALFNIDGRLERGQRVTRGQRIGKVARRGCAQGDRLRIALYRPQLGTNDDSVAEREGVPFTGEWAIAGCEYPDDTHTMEQYRGELVPCPSNQ